ncbi:MAG: UbiA family prenyltransferase [Calditrichia bacterium]
MKTKVIALWQLSRPVNMFIGMLSIFLAAAITGTVQPLRNVLLAVLSGGLITAAANTINDFFDLAIDRVNKPYRPLPAGRLSPSLARKAAMLEFILGITLSAGINLPALMIAAIFSALLYFYSARLKRLPLWGNLTVSLATAFAFIYGGVAVHRVEAAFYPATFAFFFHLGREIIKDIQDIRGDSREKARTFPLVYGIIPALWLTTGVFILLTVLTIWPYLSGYYQLPYMLTVTVGIYPVLLYSLWQIWRDQSFAKMGLVSNLLKADMLVGLLAIYLG